MLAILLLALLPAAFLKNTYQIDGEVNNHQQSIDFTIRNTDPTPGPTDLQSAFVIMKSLDQYILNLKISDETSPRYDPSYSNIFLHENEFDPVQTTFMGITLNSAPFGFNLKNLNTSTPILTTNVYNETSLILQDKYIEFSISVYTNTIMGLGQQVGPLQLCQARTKCTYTLWSRGGSCPISNGDGGANCYGYHPFMMGLLNDGSFFGILMWSTNAMDVVVDKHYGYSTLTYKITGGLINAYFIYSGTAELILQKYHTLIGKPALLPLWSLGWHQAKLGWESAEQVKEVASNYIKANIPIDGMWVDVDYMNSYESFTVGNAFGDMKSLADFLHSSDMKLMPIIESGIKYRGNSNIYADGLKINGFIKSAETNKPVIGKSDAGYVVYPDFQNPQMIELWRSGFSTLWNIFTFDGIWLDQNEPYSKCLGECLSSADHDPNEYDNLPYYPGNENLNDRTISLTSYQKSSSGIYDSYLKMFNTHNLYGLQEIIEAYNFLNSDNSIIQQRPFIISRSTFPSSGSVGGSWLGDNPVGQEYFTYAISGTINFQLFGIPFTGPNLCGYSGSITEEECFRWLQLGCALPFSRMNFDNSDPSHKYPYQFTKYNAKYPIMQKYVLLRHYYSLMYNAAIYGGAYINPVIFNFPTDNNTLQMTDTHFMIGESLLVSPILAMRTSQVSTYFPNANWFDLFTHRKIVTYNPYVKEGAKLLLNDVFKYVNIHIKGGSIIPYQPDNYSKFPMNSKDANEEFPTSLLIAPNEMSTAAGDCYYDDGISRNAVINKEFRHYVLRYASKRLDIKLDDTDYSHDLFGSEYLSNVTIMDYDGERFGCLQLVGGLKLGLLGHVDDALNTVTFYLGGQSLASVKSLTAGKWCY